MNYIFKLYLLFKVKPNYLLRVILNRSLNRIYEQLANLRLGI